MDNEVVKILEGVLEMLSSEDGWCQGQTSQFILNEDGSRKNVAHCLVGAVLNAATSSPAQTRAINCLTEAAGIDITSWRRAESIHPLAIFNDQPSTTQENVILLVKRTIHETESQ